MSLGTIPSAFLNQVWRQADKERGFTDEEIKAVKQTFRALRNGNYKRAKAIARTNSLARQLLHNAFTATKLMVRGGKNNA